MVVLKHVNNISDQLRAEIPQLQDGEVRRYRMLTGHPNNDPRLEVRQIAPVVYGFVQIPCHDRIKDPYDNNKTKEIGVVETFDVTTERATKYKCFIPGNTLPVARTDMKQFWNGEFSLTGGNLDDEDLFEYLCLTNYNNSNPYRDKRVTPLFEEIRGEETELQSSETTHKKRGRKPKEEVVM